MKSEPLSKASLNALTTEPLKCIDDVIKVLKTVPKNTPSAEILKILVARKKGRPQIQRDVLVNGKRAKKCTFYNVYFYVNDKFGKPVFYESKTQTYSKQGSSDYYKIAKKVKVFRAELAAKKNLSYDDVLTQTKEYKDKLVKEATPPDHYIIAPVKTS